MSDRAPSPSSAPPTHCPACGWKLAAMSPGVYCPNPNCLVGPVAPPRSPALAATTDAARRIDAFLAFWDWPDDDALSAALHAHVQALPKTAWKGATVRVGDLRAFLTAEAWELVATLTAENATLRAAASPPSPAPTRHLESAADRLAAEVIAESKLAPTTGVVVPAYPSGAHRYRRDGHGWLIYAEGYDGNHYRGALVSESDDLWVRARFAECLDELAKSVAALRSATADAEERAVSDGR